MVFQSRTYSVLLVSAAEKFNEKTLTLLPVTDYWPVEVARSVGEARRCLLDKSYDIVLINAPLPDDFGSQLAMDICARSGSAALLFVKSELFDEVAARVTDYGVLAVAKPVALSAVEQALRMLRAMRERLRRLEEKQLSIEEHMADIRAVNHAKWLLIERLSMTEAEAHRYIEKQAMDQRVSAREMADRIIATYE